MNECLRINGQCSLCAACSKGLIESSHWPRAGIVIIISCFGNTEAQPERCSYFPKVTQLQTAMIRVTIYWAHVMSRLWAEPLAPPQILIRVPKSPIVYPGFQVTELGLREVKPHTQGHTASWDWHQRGASSYRCQDLSSGLSSALGGTPPRLLGGSHLG